jgi:ATP-dependent helicase/nuclease subunit A
MAQGDPLDLTGLVDAGARQRALADLDTTLLVEAAAGSGKTTLLLGRIVSLVRAGRARLSEIAAVTFTEKAAAELRMRLRTALEAADLPAALRDLEAARIGTIHAFAGTLLRERPVEAGIDPGFTVADPLKADLLRAATWERWLETSLEDPAAAEPVRQAIELGLPLGRLRTLAMALCDERDLVAAIPAPAEPGEPHAEMDRDMRAAADRLLEMATAHARDPADRAAEAVTALAAWAAQTAGLPGPERVKSLLEEAPLPEASTVGRLGNQARWRPREALIECRRILAALATRRAAARAAARHDLVVALAAWARGFVDAYQAHKTRAGCLDFADLLLCARDLVRDHPEVRRDFQRRIRYLLVDEFQDTDPLQLELILTLMRGAPPGSLFIVGDPKQSIYRFRRADIETYEAAKTEIAARGAVLAVRANFRSGRALLDAVNRVFDGVMMVPPDGAYQPDYVPLEPHPDTEAGRRPVLLRLPAAQPPAASGDEARAREAAIVATWLRGQVEAGAFAYGDVALLFRAMTAVALYEDAFRAAGVPFHTVGGRHYYDRSEVGWTIAALAAVEDPHDPVALVGALRSPFFGVTDEALAGLRRAGGAFSYLRPLPPGTDPGLAFAWAVLADLHRDRTRLAPPALIEELYARTQVLAAYALDVQGEGRVANLLKVLDTARALEATGTLTFRALVRWLRERGATRYEEEESVLAEEGDDAVRLLTIHKAKGLEFSVVVVPDLGRGPASRPGVLLVDRRAGALAIDLGALGRERLTTLNWDDLAQRETQRAEAEALRLLYVALTRARQVLVLPEPTAPEPGSFHGFLAPLTDGPVEVVEPAALAAAAPAPPPADALGGEPLPVWRARRDALLREAGQTTPVVRPAAEIAPARAAGERGDARRIGALVHAALATVDLARPEDVPAVVHALGARQAASAAVVERATRLVTRALASPVLARARRAAWVGREVPVMAEVDGVLVDGRVDLVFEEADGLVTVEIKTDADPDAGAAQANLYAGALGRALGRPVREALVLRVGG